MKTQRSQKLINELMKKEREKPEADDTRLLLGNQHIHKAGFFNLH